MRLGLLGILMASALLLTIVSFDQLVEQKLARDQFNQTPVLFAQHKAKENAQLDQAIQSYQRSLEYMTFRSEQKKLERKWINALRKKINSTPSEAPTWQYLANAEYQFQPGSEDSQFSLQRALLLNAWEHQRQPNLVHLCLQQQSHLSEHTAKLCDELMLNFPWNPNLAYQAKKLRVSPELLATKLTALGLL